MEEKAVTWDGYNSFNAMLDCSNTLISDEIYVKDNVKTFDSLCYIEGLICAFDTDYNGNPTISYKHPNFKINSYVKNANGEYSYYTNAPAGFFVNGMVKWSGNTWNKRNIIVEYFSDRFKIIIRDSGATNLGTDGACSIFIFGPNYPI